MNLLGGSPLHGKMITLVDVEPLINIFLRITH